MACTTDIPMENLSSQLVEQSDSRPSAAMAALVDFLGGVAGGAASVLVGQPLDTVKVKLQTFPALYQSAARCFIDTLRSDGVFRGLYAGTVPSLAAQVSENAMLFFAYGMCQRAVAAGTGRADVADLSVPETAVAGSCAGFFAATVLCPTELIKCKLQAAREVGSKASNLGAVSLTRHILRSEGMAGLFRGLVPTLAREMFGYSFFFGGYETCRSFLTPPGGKKEDLGALSIIASGGMGGVAFWVAIFPADVIKSRVQVQTTSGFQQMSLVQMMVEIGRTEGVQGLYRGLGPCLLRTFPATGVLFLFVEKIKELYRKFDSTDMGSD